MPTISECVVNFNRVVQDARMPNTARTYSVATKKFCQMLADSKIDPKTSSIDLLTESHFGQFISTMRTQSPGTEGVYIVAIKNFYKFLGAEDVRQFNYPRIESIIKFRKRKPPLRLPQFPVEDITEVIKHVDEIINHDFESMNERLRAYRDRALIYTLPDTGLRIGEAMALLIGSINKRKGIAVVRGKNNEEAVVRFTKKSLNAIWDYLNIRYQLDMKAGKQRASLPIFANHSDSAGNHVTAITPSTGGRIIAMRVQEILKHHPEIKITPHSFRHLFVSRIYKEKKNIKLAQELARHKKIETTRIYTHLDDDNLDQGYHDVFGE